MALEINIEELMNSNTKSGPICVFERIIEDIQRNHGEEDALKLSDVIDNKSVPPRNLVAFLRQHDYEVSTWQVNYHRRRDTGAGCRCK